MIGAEGPIAEPASGITPEGDTAVLTTKPGLVSYSFAAIDAPADVRRRTIAHLAALWESCQGLGMTDPIFRGVPVRFPDVPELAAPTFRLLAGRGRSDRGTAQAFLFARHDVIGLCTGLGAPDEDDALDGWRSLLEAWKGATSLTETPDGMLDECLVFSCLANPRAEGRDDLLGSDVRRALKACGLDCWEPAFRSREGLVFWEGPRATGRRILAVAAPAQAERTLDTWIWWRGGRELARLGLYLLAAAKVRYEIEVHRARREALRASLADVEAKVGALLFVEAESVGEKLWAHDLAVRQAALLRVHGDAAGLAEQMSRLRELDLTARILSSNLRLFAPEPAPGDRSGDDSPFVRDAELASWLEQQVALDIGYAEAASERVSRANALASIRLEGVARELDRVRSRVTVYQTTVLAALLGAFTAMQALSIRFAPHPNLELPALAFITTLFLALPLLALRWHEPYGLVDRVAAGSFGASTGWLLLALSWTEASAPASLTAGAVGAAAAVALVFLRDAAAKRERPDGRSPAGWQRSS